MTFTVVVRLYNTLLYGNNLFGDMWGRLYAGFTMCCLAFQSNSKEHSDVIIGEKGTVTKTCVSVLYIL